VTAAKKARMAGNVQDASGKSRDQDGVQPIIELQNVQISSLRKNSGGLAGPGHCLTAMKVRPDHGLRRLSTAALRFKMCSNAISFFQMVKALPGQRSFFTARRERSGFAAIRIQRH
jgi:hypothetical protein